jgi:hypothetical protein
VISRLGVIAAGGVEFDLQNFAEPRTVLDVFETGDLEVTEELAKLQPLTPSWHAFTVEEPEALVEERGWRVRKAMVPGALAGFVSVDLLTALFDNKNSYQRYLDFEERFDSDRTVLGVAGSGAGGLSIIAERV